MIMNSSQFWTRSFTTAKQHILVVSTASASFMVASVAAVGIHNSSSLEAKNEAPQSPTALKSHVPSSSSSSSSSFDGLSPTPPIYIFQPNNMLEIAFDTRTRNPIYVMERIIPDTKTNRNHNNNNNNNNNSQSSQPPKLKRPNFYEEKSLPEEFRSRISHYRHTGYDRGHLAAAANYMHLTQKEVNDTFSLCNVSPQNHSMNCTIWAQLERWTQKVAQENDQQHDADTYVVSGPLWMPTKQLGEKVFEVCHHAIGSPPCLVSVPTHFFKVVVGISKRHPKCIIKFACFVIPNQDLQDSASIRDSNSNQRRLSLEMFLVPWSSLEAVCGIHFFPLLATSEWKDRANQLTLDIVKSSSDVHTATNSIRLLTDGSRDTNISRSNKTKWSWAGRKEMELDHLCTKGRCK